VSAKADAGTAAQSAAAGAKDLPLPVLGSRILVVDDIEWNRVLIGTLLSSVGFNNIAYACDGIEALRMIDEATPDLVVLDIMMPVMDGFEVCERLRKDARFDDMPILVQTALTGIEDRNRAFEVGTTDLVCKPLDRAELVARVRIHLENRLLIKDLREYRRRVEGELAIAREIFEHLLPGPQDLEELTRQCGIAVRSDMIQASALGGDIWGVWGLGPGRMGVYLLDMPGRGVSAALNVCRLHTLVRDLLPVVDQPSEFLALLNDRAVTLLERGDYAAVIYGIVDINDHSFTYAAAAANSLLVLTPDGQVLIGDGGGLPLGIANGCRFEQRRLAFPDGSALLLMSNAVFDALDTLPVPAADEAGGTAGMEAGAGAVDAGDGAADGNPASLARLLALVRSASGGRITAGSCAAVASAFRRQVGERPADDHTLIWITAAEPEESGGLAGLDRY